MFRSIAAAFFLLVCYCAHGQATRGLSSAGPKGNDKPAFNVALIIGTDNYQNKNWPHLSNPAFDAKTLKVDLENKFDYKVVYLANPTRKEILDNLDKIKKTIADENSSRSTNLLIFIAGHGNYKEIVNGYFVPSDASDKADSYIYYDDFRPVVDAIPAQHTLVLLDVCYGSSFVPPGKRSATRGTSEMYAPMPDEEYIKKNKADNSRIYIASGRLESVQDGLQDSHSPFAYMLFDCLERGYLEKK